MSAVYRVDKFRAPDDVGEEFWAHEEADPPGRFNALTIVGWQSAEALEAAKPAVGDAHAAVRFDPAAFLASAGISAISATIETSDRLLTLPDLATTMFGCRPERDRLSRRHCPADEETAPCARSRYPTTVLPTS